MVSLLSTVQALPDDDRADVERALVGLARQAAVGALAAGVVHDAANALFGLTGLIGLIREGESISPRGRTLLANAAGDLDGTLRPLLRFAQPADDAGSRADLAAVVRDALDLYRHGDRKTLEIEERLPGTPVRVDVPGSVALQAVVHLLLAADPVQQVAVAAAAVTVAPAREPSLDELVAARIVADAGGALERADGAFRLRLPSA